LSQFTSYRKQNSNMKHVIRIYLVILISTTNLQAQIIKGKITNQSGEPIKYATVYIQELKQGTTSNTKGDYELKLLPGKYSVIYQSLGYQAVFIDLTITNKTISKDVILPIQYYEIPEVRITATGEDPAYIIMRKVIGMAPYYLNNVSYYKAEVYLKGNLVINKIPRLLQKSMKINSDDHGSSVSAGNKKANEEKTLKAGDSFLMESFNEMEFTAPDKYFQKVISYNSTFPEQGNDISPMDFIQASFYQPVLADMAITPLSPAAFSHYRFKYLGSSPQGNFTINKIQVIPKRKSQQLFEGTIYVIEDLWCLHSVDLTNENMVGKIRIQQLYVPVENDIWMPVSHKFEINISIIGFKADVGYGSSVKYLEVRPNLALKKPKSIPVDYTGKPVASVNKPDTVVSKARKQIDKILEKDKISNRDMVKLSRLMEKESEKSILNDSSKKNLEIQDHTTHVIEKDAAKKDSAYWAEIRPIPLSDVEIRALRMSDSLKAESSLRKMKNDTIVSSEKKVKSAFKKTMKYVVSGHTWSDTTGLHFTYGGLIDSKNFSFNTVDGFIYGMNFSLYKSWKKNRSFSLYPDIRYAFNRDQLMWRVSANYMFNGLKQKQLYLRTGKTSKDIANAGSINTFLNSVSSLFFKKNYLKLYDSRYLTLGYTTELSNGLNIGVSSTYEKRGLLVNTTGFSFIKTSRLYTDNEPVNSYLLPFSGLLRDQIHADISARVSFTPFQRYRIRNGTKMPRGSDWPTFSVTWQHGINEPIIKSARYYHTDMIKFEADKRKEFGAFSEFRWRVRAGGYLNNKNLTYYDFFHFNSQSTPVLLDDYQDAFMIPTFYTLSTPEVFGEVHIKYTTPYLLLKLLPVLSNTLIRENLSLSYLGSRYHQNYTELGYSLSEVLLLAEIGVYVGFDDGRFRAVGAKLVLKFN
jgi:hypothetical protein